jgi:hypothetical protein
MTWLEALGSVFVSRLAMIAIVSPFGFFVGSTASTSCSDSADFKLEEDDIIARICVVKATVLGGRALSLVSWTRSLVEYRKWRCVWAMKAKHLVRNCMYWCSKC